MNNKIMSRRKGFVFFIKTQKHNTNQPIITHKIVGFGDTEEKARINAIHRFEGDSIIEVGMVRAKDVLNM